MNENFLKYNGWKIFLFLTFLTISISCIINYFIIDDKLYYQSYGEFLASYRIAKMIKFAQKWQWISYFLIPIQIFIRVSFAAICIYIRVIFSDIKVRFKDLFKIALIADFVFLLAGFFKLVLILFFKHISVFEDLQFQPMSLLELFDRKSVKSLFIYPLSLISVFELLYWIVLIWLLATTIRKSIWKSFKIVASSYGIGLLLWVIIVMYVTIILS